MNAPHETQQTLIRAAVAALNRLKLLGVLTATKIGTITASGTVAKLVALIQTNIDTPSPALHDADQVRQASLAFADLKKVLNGYGAPVILDADVETARADVTNKFNALYNPLKALMRVPADLENSGNQ